MCVPNLHNSRYVGRYFRTLLREATACTRIDWHGGAQRRKPRMYFAADAARPGTIQSIARPHGRIAFVEVFEDR